jgi:FMN-dependent NADH-azoreductase
MPIGKCLTPPKQTLYLHNPTVEEDGVRILHIVASPRGAQSNTLRVSEAFLESLRAGRGDVEVESIDLYNQDLPAMAGDNIEAKYTLMVGQPIDKEHETSWRQIEQLIGHFLAADAYVLSSPMWNLSTPYALKYYIDCIVQPGYLFRYDEIGQVVPMVNNKKMLCVTSRGGDYSAGTPRHPYDFLEPYLRSIFGFVGITDIEFVNAQPMDVSPDLRTTALEAAIAHAVALATSPEWAKLGVLPSASRAGTGLRREPARTTAARGPRRQQSSGATSL